MAKIVNPSFAIQRVIADIDYVALLISEAVEVSRKWEMDDVSLTEKQADDILQRLSQGVRALCHASETDDHSTTVRARAVAAVIAQQGTAA